MGHELDEVEVGSGLASYKYNILIKTHLVHPTFYEVL